MSGLLHDCCWMARKAVALCDFFPFLFGLSSLYIIHSRPRIADERGQRAVEVHILMIHYSQGIWCHGFLDGVFDFVKCLS